MCVFVLFVPSWFYKCVYDNQSAEWDMKQHRMDVKWKQWQAQLKITSSEWDEAEWDAAQETGNKQKVWLCLVYSLAVNMFTITCTGCSLAEEHKNVPFAQLHTSSMLLHLWRQCVSQALNKSDFYENRFQHKMWKTETVGGGQMVGMGECCSLGCRLGGGAWKRPCHGLPLVESGQCPSNHPAPTLSSLPSVNRAGDAVTAPWNLRVRVRVCVCVALNHMKMQNTSSSSQSHCNHTTHQCKCEREQCHLVGIWYYNSSRMTTIVCLLCRSLKDGMFGWVGKYTTGCGNM